MAALVAGAQALALARVSSSLSSPSSSSSSSSCCSPSSECSSSAGVVSLAPRKRSGLPCILPERSAYMGESVSGFWTRTGISLRCSRPRKPHAGCKASIGAAVLADIAKETVAPAIGKPRADPRTVVSLILGGGAGTRLFPLTNRRAKPAVPIGGAYRLIDVPMSNCINSGINKIFILTQFNSASLNRHLARTYNFGNGVNFGDGFVEVLAATQTPGEAGMNWFQGTADAVRQFTWVFEDTRSKEIENVLVLSGDHLYRMDYMEFIQKHQDTGADITIGCVPMDDSRASDFGLMKIDANGQILYFSEKPKGADLKAMQVDTTVLGLTPEEAIEKPYIASMGIYVFKKDILLKLLRWRYPTANDFGSEILPASAKEYNVQAYLFNDYWEDIGTIKSFYEANLALTCQPPKFRFYDAAKPIYTSPRYLPPTKIEKCRVLDSIVSHGCFLQECSVTHSVIGIRSRVEAGAEIQDTMMLGADFYETEAEIASMVAEGKVPVGVGQNAKIRNCILDKNVRIGKNVVIANKDNVQEAEKPSEGYYIRSGITVILKNATIADGTVI
ncbi:glucose-1-phosphate adenylyltransferase large subunit 1 isoform X2 [Selaginella moellendorffii]|uniref:glucose-1-phosphate adenylyltransferase large subunit 1 isoform X2 n=1 Tax=Selaginella moellendorffii TaxID=88036 RepID=UPI000D1D030E|nr:glucose-1-phosphate adenylyltransferase large subunit 1 isoform X2 [Selaginella moellendorffii]|eukprot:XP_024530960.1 glucose-1-phosphate adenylyltransferase large subunit 1 isoform X2 [Selaginella moellendorffii]